MREEGKLPRGWTSVRLGDLVVPKITRDPTKEAPGTFEYIDVSSVDNSRGSVTDAKTLCREQAPSRARRLVRRDDVLFCLVRPYLRNVALVPERLDGQVASTAFCVLRSRPGCHPRFLFHQVSSDEFINALPTYGNSPPSAREDELLDQIVVFAPQREQRRIITKIEELFSELDAGVEALERAQAKLERYRASVLKAAVEGKLTERWRTQNPPEETGEELLERILAERRKKWEAEQLAKYRVKGKKPPKGWRDRYREPNGPDTGGLPDLPASWCWASVDQVSVVVRGASPRPAGDPRYFDGDDTPWITVGELTRIDGPFLTEVRSFLTKAGRARSRVVPADTLLLTNSGATLGVPRITLIEGCINDGSVAMLGLEYPLKLFLHHYLSTLTMHLRAIRQGAAQPNLNTSIVKRLAVPLPPEAEQKVIVSLLDASPPREAALGGAVSGSQVRGYMLRQTILKRAFEGRLVPQDPNDEPASVLLERIRAERDGSGPKRTPREKKSNANQQSPDL